MDKPVEAGKTPVALKNEAGTYWWCACGRSANQPFCDGSHKGTGIVPLEVKITSPGENYWCMCKRTKTPPFCDGSHKTPA